MSIIGDLVFLLRGDPKQLNVDVNKAGDVAGASFGKRMAAGFKKSWSGQNIGKGLVQGLGLAGGLGAVGLFSMAISKVTDVLQDSVVAAIADQASISKLGTALRANIPNWDGNTKAIERTLKARMNLGFSDDEQRESLALIAVATKDVTRALEVQRVAMDLARLKGISLADASAALIKVEAGQYRGLKALGIQLKAGATQTEALAAVTAVAEGQAAAYAETVEGKMLRAQVAIGEKMEDFGYKLLPAVGDALTNILFAFDKTSVSFDEFVKRAGAGDRGAAGTLTLLKHASDDTGASLQRLWQVAQDQEIDFATARVKDFRAALKVAGEEETLAAEKVKAGASSITKSMDTVTKTSEEMAEEIEKANKIAADSWDNLQKSLVSSAKDIIDDAYDPIIDLDRLRANTAELAAVRVILASSKSTAAEKRDARDKLHELKKNNAEYLLALAEAGQTGDAAYAKGISELKTAIKNAKGPAKAALQEVLDKIREVERVGKVIPLNFIGVGVGLGNALNNIFRAEGGPQAAGRPYIVGERGPEIHVPSVSGRILSTSQSIAAVSGGGGGGDTFNVHTYGMPGRAETPAETVAVWRREARVGNIKPPRGPSGWKT